MATWSLRERPVCQALAGVADEGRQACFDVEMHVFEFELPFKGAGGDFLADLSHAAANVGKVLFGDHANLGEHGRMSQRAVDVGHGHALVKVDAGRIAKHKSVHGLRESARPGLLLSMQRIVGVVVFLRHYLSLFPIKRGESLLRLIVPFSLMPHTAAQRRQSIRQRRSIDRASPLARFRFFCGSPAC